MVSIGINTAEFPRFFNARGARLLQKFGPDEAKKKMQEVLKPPRKNYGKPTGNALLWNASGVSVIVSCA